MNLEEAQKLRVALDQSFEETFLWNELHRLDTLWNIDKHRRLALMAWWPNLIYWGSNGPSNRRALPGDGTLADGSILLYIDGTDEDQGDELSHEFNLVLTDDPAFSRDHYTLHPHGEPAAAPPTTAALHQQTAEPIPAQDLLSDPELTGMPRHQLDALTVALAQSQATQREQHRHARRGAPRRRAPGAGNKAKLSDPDRVLATVLYLRRLCNQTVLADLFGVDRSTITKAVREVLLSIPRNRRDFFVRILRFSDLER